MVRVSGGATVVRAIDHHYGRCVVLKFRPARKRDACAAALAEARVLLDLDPHPGIAVVRNHFFTRYDHVLVADHVDGSDLARRLAEDGTPGLPVDLVLGWLQDVACALDHVHGATPAVVHGDVKPANIVVTAGAPHAAVLIDFGKVRTTARSRATRPFAAPELSRGASTPASDVFALAATAHTLLTGTPPAPTGRADWSAVAPEAQPTVQAVLAHGLATQPSLRPTSAGELVAALCRAAR